MAKQKFSAPQADVYNTVIQSAEPAKPAPEAEEFYRFNCKFPGIFKPYLQEMAWRNRISITEYVTRLINADMAAHPEWTDTLDILNK